MHRTTEPSPFNLILSCEPPGASTIQKTTTNDISQLSRTQAKLKVTQDGHEAHIGRQLCSLLRLSHFCHAEETHLEHAIRGLRLHGCCRSDHKRFGKPAKQVFETLRVQIMPPQAAVFVAKLFTIVISAIVSIWGGSRDGALFHRRPLALLVLLVPVSRTFGGLAGECCTGSAATSAALGDLLFSALLGGELLERVKPKEDVRKMKWLKRAVNYEKRNGSTGRNGAQEGEMFFFLSEERMWSEGSSGLQWRT